MYSYTITQDYKITDLYVYIHVPIYDSRYDVMSVTKYSTVITVVVVAVSVRCEEVLCDMGEG